MNYSLRQAVQQDIEWLDPFYEKVMRPYVEVTHEWNDTVFREKYNPDQCHIIQKEGRDIGLVKKEMFEGRLFLWDIQLEPAYRNFGIGTSIIRSIQEEAEEGGLPVRLRVLKGNHAIHLYRRLGFRQVEEFENCFELEWKPERELSIASKAAP